MGSMLALSWPSSLILGCLMETAGTVSVNHVGNTGTESRPRGLCPCQIPTSLVEVVTSITNFQPSPQSSSFICTSTFFYTTLNCISEFWSFVQIFNPKPKPIFSAVRTSPSLVPHHKNELHNALLLSQTSTQLLNLDPQPKVLNPQPSTLNPPSSLTTLKYAQVSLCIASSAPTLNTLQNLKLSKQFFGFVFKFWFEGARLSVEGWVLRVDGSGVKGQGSLGSGLRSKFVLGFSEVFFLSKISFPDL